MKPIASTAWRTRMRLGVGGDVPARGAAWPRRPAAGLVVLVEEGHVGSQV